MSIVNSSTGEFIREQTAQEQQVYNALEKWSERLNRWEYSKTIKKGKKRKYFIPNAFSLQLIENMQRMTRQEITPEQAMSILFIIKGKAETRMCMEAGFQNT